MKPAFRVLVTGAGRGIGRETCLALARNGASVAGIARSETDLASLGREIAAHGGNFLGLSADVTDSLSIGKLFMALSARWESLDALVNNAGGAIGFGDFFDTTDEEWLATFELNVLGLVRTVRSALPLLRAAPKPTIVNILSAVAHEPGWAYPHYAASKAAALNLTKYLASRLAPDGIRVNSISPGPVRSSAWSAAVAHQAKRRNLAPSIAEHQIEAEESRKIPLGRIGEPADITGLVGWLISDEASWVTGSDFVIDGGKSRSI